MKVRHRANKADALSAAGNLVIRSRAVRSKLRLRNQIAMMQFDPAIGQTRHYGIMRDHDDRAPLLMQLP